MAIANVAVVPSRPREERESIGQFLTPPPTAHLLAHSFSDNMEGRDIRLLDPGAGAGALTEAFVERALAERVRSLSIVLVENDQTILPRLEEAIARFRQAAKEADIPLEVILHKADFLRLANSEGDLFSPARLEPNFTHAVMNPPYYKISADSEERNLLSRAGIEISNIYAGFVALGLQLLGPDGELVAITPRSFCNGPYFRPFREMLTTGFALRKFHVVASRTKAFSEDAVLQENVVFAVQKTTATPKTIDVCSSEQATYEGEECHRVPYDLVVHPKDDEKVFYLPVDAESVECMTLMSELPCTLNELGLTVSTGPVVDFRAKNLLRKNLEDGTVPLIYASHFTKSAIEWPKDGKKPNAVMVSPELMRFLVPNGTYVLTKRFTSKEEKKRIVARVLREEQFSFDLIGLENHLNFFHENQRGLDTSLAFGLAAYLNWTIVDKFLRLFNGHTQVNASDLRLIRYPNRETLVRIGQQIENESAPWEQALLDGVVANTIATTPQKR